MEDLKLKFSSEKLYGRKAETAKLKEVYQQISQPSIECCDEQHVLSVLVNGASGTGKSALIETLRKPCTNDGGFFACGKYDQLRSKRPYSALADALTDLTEQLGESQDDELIRDTWEGLKDEAGILDMQVVPGFAKTFHQQRKDNTDGARDIEAAGMATGSAFDRLAGAIRSYLREVSSRRPVVLFIDDLQWADKGSLDLIASILSDLTLPILFVGAYRNDETDKEDAIVEVFRASSSITELKVSDLSKEALNDMITDLLNCEEDDTLSLTELVYRKTHGNVLFVIHFLQQLEDVGFLYHSIASYKWEWNLAKIESETSLSDNVVDMVTQKLKRQPTELQEVLQLAACLGSRFPLDAVSTIWKLYKEHKSDLSRPWGSDFVLAKEDEGHRVILQRAIDENLIDETKFYCKFAHDRIQQAAYSMIENEKEKLQLHLRIGELLRDWYSRDDQHEWMLFVAADQMNRGSDMLTGREERVNLASLNLLAAEKVAAKSAFFTASEYVQNGIELLDRRNMWTENYELTRKLCILFARMEYCSGHFEKSTYVIKDIVDHAKSLEDKLPAYYTWMDCLRAEKKNADAASLGFEVLSLLGQRFPKKIKLRHVLIEFLPMRQKLRSIADEEVLALPAMESATVEAQMFLMSRMKTALHWAHEMAGYALIGVRMVKATLQHGLCPTTPLGFVRVANFYAKMHHFDEASRFEKLARLLQEKINAKEFSAKVNIALYGFSYPLRHPLAEALEGLLTGYKDGMEYGDVYYGHNCCLAYIFCYFYCGLPLPVMVDDAAKFINEMDQYRQRNASVKSRLYRQAALNLMGRSKDCLVLEGDAIPDLSALKKAKDVEKVSLGQYIDTLMLQLAYYFGDLELAEKHAVSLAKHNNSEWPIFYAPHQMFFRGMIWLALVGSGKRKFVMEANREMKLLKKFVAKGKMVNCYHLHLLLQAEYRAVTRRKDEMVEKMFQEAIAASSRSGFLQHNAVANERAGVYYLKTKGEADAKFYLQQAVDLYFDWGANGKAEHLLDKFPFLNDSTKMPSSRSMGVRGRQRYTNEVGDKHRKKDFL